MGWTVLLTIAGFLGFTSLDSVLGGLVAFVLAIVAGRYAYRIWTWRARVLWFVIII